MVGNITTGCQQLFTTLSTNLMGSYLLARVDTQDVRHIARHFIIRPQLNWPPAHPTHNTTPEPPDLTLLHTDITTQHFSRHAPRIWRPLSCQFSTDLRVFVHTSTKRSVCVLGSPSRNSFGVFLVRFSVFFANVAHVCVCAVWDFTYIVY